MKRTSTLALSLAAVLACGVTARVAHADDSKIAFVDLQRALEETDDGKAAKAKLKSDFDKKQQELDAKQEELKKLKEEFDKKSTLMKDDAKQKAAADLQQRFMQLQETFARLQKDLAQKEQDATRGILGRLSQVVAQIADRDHFALVLEKNSAVVYGQPALDITSEVIRMYNRQSGSGSKSKK